MKIKTVKKINLPELIQYVWENEVFPSVWRSEESPSDKWTIQFFEDGMFRSYNGFHEYDTFTVEVEEELTNRTKLPDLVIVYNDNFIITDSEECISEYINDYDNESVSNRMYVPYKGGLKLVWSRKNGIPKHGTLEVSE